MIRMRLSTASAQGGIKMVFLIIPAVFSIASVVMFLLYRIKDDSDIEKMEQEIAKTQSIDLGGVVCVYTKRKLHPYCQ